MAGHSKWANIKFRKAAQDKKRGKIFTKYIREITVAAKQGGGDASANPALRQAIDKALRGNMTRDVIDRAIKRGVGGDSGAELVPMTYEGYGVDGVAVFVECLSDNKNRTVSEVRHAFTKYGGNLGTTGSVSYLFEKIGQLIVSKGPDVDEVLEFALENGAEEVEEQEDGSILIETPGNDFLSFKESCDAKGYELSFAEVTMKSANYVNLPKDSQETIMKMIDMLEDSDDVQAVYSNAILDEIMI